MVVVSFIPFPWIPYTTLRGFEEKSYGRRKTETVRRITISGGQQNMVV